MREVLAFDDPNNEVEIYIPGKMKKGTMMADFAATVIVPFFSQFLFSHETASLLPHWKEALQSFYLDRFFMSSSRQYGQRKPL